MSEIQFLVALSDLSEDFIEEAETVRFEKHAWKKTLFRVASVFLVIGIAAVLFFRVNWTGGGVNPLSVSAMELGIEEYTFGVALPNVIYGDDNIIIMYDFRGIYVYDLNMEKLTGFSDFRSIDMTTIQGDNPTLVEVSENGNYVKFYNENEKYLYDVKSNKTSHVEDYLKTDTSFVPYSTEIVPSGDANSLSDNYVTYKVKGDAFVVISLEHDYVNAGKVVQYKDLRLTREKDGNQQEYVVFQ